MQSSTSYIYWPPYLTQSNYSRKDSIVLKLLKPLTMRVESVTNTCLLIKVFLTLFQNFTNLKWVFLFFFLLCILAVKILQTISDKVKNLNWRVTQSSCQGGRGFDNRKISRDEDQIIRNVTCNCFFNNGTVCHVTSVYGFFSQTSSYYYFIIQFNYVQFMTAIYISRQQCEFERTK